jgi:hypothetical protein
MLDSANQTRARARRGSLRSHSHWGIVFSPPHLLPDGGARGKGHEARHTSTDKHTEEISPDENVSSLGGHRPAWTGSGAWEQNLRPTGKQQTACRTPAAVPHGTAQLRQLADAPRRGGKYRMKKNGGREMAGGGLRAHGVHVGLLVHAGYPPQHLSTSTRRKCAKQTCFFFMCAKAAAVNVCLRFLFAPFSILHSPFCVRAFAVVSCKENI